MKFLIDAHLPKKLSLLLQWKGYNSLHTLDLPNKNRTTDSQINQISVDEKRVLISKDLDFIESIILSNKPYKLISVATGNISNKKLLEIFSRNIDIMVQYLKNSKVIEVTNDTIIVKDIEV